MRDMTSGSNYIVDTSVNVEKPVKFWMCYVQHKETPKRFHATYLDAAIEANRLVRLPENRGKMVCVLEAMSYCIAEEVPVKWNTF